MITDSDLEFRIRKTLRDVAVTTEVSAWLPAHPRQRTATRRYRPVWVAVTSFVGVILAIGVAVGIVDQVGSDGVATGPLPPPQACEGTEAGSAAFIGGTAGDIHPSLLFLPTYVPEGLSLNQAWSTDGGTGCLGSPAFSLIDWAADQPDRAEAVIQVQHGLDTKGPDLSGPPPGDHVFDVIDYSPGYIIGNAAGDMPVTVRSEGVSLDEAMELLDRITVDADTGSLQLEGATGRFELIPGSGVEPVSQILPLHNWYVGDLGETSDEPDLLNLWIRFEPGFTPAAHLRKDAELIDINDTEGVYYQYPVNGPVEIEWELAAGVVATLHVQHIDIATAELIKMAESVHPVTPNDPAIPPSPNTNG